MRTFSSILLVFLHIFPWTSTIYCQEIISLTNITGEYIVGKGSDLTLKQGEHRAYMEAKTKALKEAGIAEMISSTDLLITNEGNHSIEQDMRSVVAVEINGAVLSDTVLSIDYSINNFQGTVITVVINAEVIKYKTELDRSFDFKVDGLRELYKQGDLMTFTFAPYQEGYLKIFNFNDSESFVLYPYDNSQYPFLNDNKNFKFAAYSNNRFPMNALIGSPDTKEPGYLIESNQSRENNSLWFVFLKSNLPYNSKLDFKNFQKWLYSIPPDQRTVKIYDYIVTL